MMLTAFVALASTLVTPPQSAPEMTGAVVADDTRLASATTDGGGVLVGCGVGAAPVDPSDDDDATVGIVDDDWNLDGIK